MLRKTRKTKITMKSIFSVRYVFTVTKEFLETFCEKLYYPCQFALWDGDDDLIEKRHVNIYAGR